MGLYKYSFETKGLAVAQLHDVDCSYKDLSQVLSNMKGKTIAQARTMLESAMKMEKPIPFNKFNTGMGHRKQLGGKKGKYPKKEAAYALQLLNNAIANGEKKGLDSSKLVVKHASANKQSVFKRYRSQFVGGNTLGYGKQAMWANYVTARAEIGLAEQEPKQKKKKKEKK
ncbi:50S ribosomal protein L22 [Candidatus Micrarchaeota archaeon]|nr:50S ribosomal protein L22 [Candidatus Micrarchaeota archaeon]